MPSEIHYKATMEKHNEHTIIQSYRADSDSMTSANFVDPLQTPDIHSRLSRPLSPASALFMLFRQLSRRGLTSTLLLSSTSALRLQPLPTALNRES
jgi:hypothetical protein